MQLKPVRKESSKLLVDRKNSQRKRKMPGLPSIGHLRLAQRMAVFAQNISLSSVDLAIPNSPFASEADIYCCRLHHRTQKLLSAVCHHLELSQEESPQGHFIGGTGVFFYREEVLYGFTRIALD